MHNFFINQRPFSLLRTPLLVRLANRGLRLAGLRQQITQRPDPEIDMCSTAQRINMFHLIEGVLAYGVPGAVVELGCLAGQCALLFEKVLEEYAAESGEPPRELHLYDSFEASFGLKGDVEAALRQNFDGAGLRQPVVHKGRFEDTLPDELPLPIAFAHIDCGLGPGHVAEHQAVVFHALEALYPHLAPGAVCCLMDYHDDATGDRGLDNNPGVKLACDEFLRDRPETVVSIFGEQYSHGYFRKL